MGIEHRLFYRHYQAWEQLQLESALCLLKVEVEATPVVDHGGEFMLSRIQQQKNVLGVVIGCSIQQASQRAMEDPTGAPSLQNLYRGESE